MTSHSSFHPPSSQRRNLVLGALAGVASSLAWAQGSAEPPVRLVVPFTPGTGIDLIARQIAQPLSDRMKRSFFVDSSLKLGDLNVDMWYGVFGRL